MSPRLLSAAAAFATSLLMAGCSVFGIRSGLEQPDYEVVENLGEDIEVRRYAPRLAAQAMGEGEDRSAAESQAFRHLFDYISGENRSGAEIAMTAPVAEQAEEGTKIAMTVPVQTEAEDGGTGGDGPVWVRMRFFLPSQYERDSAPEPTGDAVELVRLEPETVAVMRFSGFRGAEKVAHKQRALLETLENTRWQPDGDPFAMFYDPPFSLPFVRRNEVAVPVETTD